jgi:hypothetical protein
MLKIHEVMRNFAKEMKSSAQANAPWDDRTGDARNGIDVSVEEHPVRPRIILFHTVDYGKWLEIRWSGRYAIIMPTIEEMGPGLIAELERAL